MPIYEYRTKGDQVVELHRSLSRRDDPVEGHPDAVRIPSRPYFSPESLYRDHPTTGRRTVLNDYDDPYEGSVGEGWAVESSEEFVAYKHEEEVAYGLADEKTYKKKMVFV